MHLKQISNSNGWVCNHTGFALQGGGYVAQRKENPPLPTEHEKHIS